MIKNLLFKFVNIILILTLLTTYNTNNIYAADIGSFLASFGSDPPDRNSLQAFLEDNIRCSEFKGEYMIAMAPMGLVSSVTTTLYGMQAISKALMESKITSLYVCGKNIINFKSQWISAMVAYNIRKKITGDDVFSETVKTFLLIAMVSLITSACLTLLINGLVARLEIIDVAEICLSDENHPFPYTEDQIRRLLVLSNEEITPENIADKKNKLCVKFGNNIFWLANGECTQDFDHPICAQNIRGYDRVLYAFTPKACPCIMNLQGGITYMPDFRRNSDGTLALDEDGKPQLTMDANLYKTRFLKNARVLGSPNSVFTPPDKRAGIIDSSCYWGNGASKRQFSISGKIVQCIYNTARNIFEKPIFGEVNSSQNYYIGKNNYDYDINLVDKKIQNINNIITPNTTFAQLTTAQRNQVRIAIDELLNMKVSNPCFQCGKTSSIAMNTISFLEKYKSSICSATIACCQTGIDSYSQSLFNQCYVNQISSLFSNTGRISIELLQNIQTIGANTINIIDLLMDLKQNITIKRDKEMHIQDSYNISNSQKGEILTYTMFDKFNNQIKFLAIILITLWMFLIGFRILFKEISLSLDVIQGLVFNFLIVYFLIFSNIWKDFLFRSILNISQGIGIFAMDITAFDNPLKDKVCNYGVYIRSPDTENLTAPNGTQYINLTCPTKANATYQLNCYKYGNYKNCIWGDCQINEPYIPNLAYEEPYFPVQYYNTTLGSEGWITIPMYCANLDGNGVSPAEIILNKQVGENVFYCPDSSKILDQGYRIDELKKLGLLKNTANSSNVYNTAIRSTDQIGNIYELPIIISSDQSDIMKRFVNRDNIEQERKAINRNRPYEKTKIENVVRDNSYMQFFDSLDCRIFRYISMGFGGMKSPGNADFDTSNIDSDGLISAIRYIFFAFPLGIIIALLMLFIGFSLLMITLKTVQSYIVGIFGLVFYVYVSPIFFAISLFESKKKARDNIISKITQYAVSAPLSFLSIGLYTVIIDLAIFGNPTRYSELFASNGSILDNCYQNSPNDAPTACLANKISKQADLSGMIQNILIILALTVAGSMLDSGTIGFAIGAATASAINVAENISVLLPFILKLAFSIIVILTGSMFLDSFDSAVRGAVGGNADLSMGTPLDGKFSDISGGSLVSSGIKSAAGMIGSVPGKIMDKIKG